MTATFETRSETQQQPLKRMVLLFSLEPDYFKGGLYAPSEEDIVLRVCGGAPVAL